MGDELCPKVSEQPVCVWPGLLQVELIGSFAHFRLTAIVDKRSLVDLPGSAQAWPQNLQIDGSPGRVVARGDVPAIELGKGAHTIEGDFSWNQLPETLQLPERIALVSLRREGVLVDFPKRDPKLLWLRETGGASDEPQRLSLEVFRKLADAIPFRITTQLQLRVAGKAREINLGRVNLPGSSALAVDSALPVRLNEDQTLSAQVYAGTHTIEIEALFATPPAELGNVPHEEPWPQTETWVFEPDPALRQVQLDGAAAVDPSRTNLPEAWRRFAAYSVAASDKLKIDTLRRGEPESPPNRLTLQREIHLDLDGEACTVADHFRGQMSRGWRLDLTNGQLGRVLLDGVPQLITANPLSGKPGVEVRETQLDLVAEWRLERGLRELPAVGWSEDVQELQTRVHVPPGWQLIGAGGVDGVSDTWLSRWDLFSLFFVLIVSIAIGQLTHRSWGALALLTLVLSHDQNEAPRITWAVLTTCIAILAVVPKGAFRKFLIGASAAVCAILIVMLGQYIVQEVRAAVHPQATFPDHPPSSPISMAPGFEQQGQDQGAIGAAAAPALEETDSLGDYALKRGSLRKQAEDVAQTQIVQAPIQKQQDPSAVVQTGPGVPNWSWQAWDLTWSGPVHREHSLRLYLLSPTGGRLISLLRIGLSALLGFLIVRFAYERMRVAPLPKRKQAATSAAALLLLFGLGLDPKVARAEIVPSNELLTELKQRITRPPLCAPNCVSVQRTDVVIENRVLSIISEVHVAADDSTQLPGPLQSWAPAEVTVNGTPAAGILLGDDGFLHLRLPPGRHRVGVRGPILGSNLTLSLGPKPRWVSVKADGWDVEGVNEAGAVEGSLGFHQQIETPRDAEPRQVSLPSWLLVTRTLQFGVSWGVTTTVERIGPTGSPLVQRFALLPGEQVTRADLTVERGAAIISLARDETQISFDSVLQVAPEVQLVAQQGERLSERWVIQCGPIWHCNSEGISPVAQQNNSSWEPRYNPWPQDRLTIRPVRPSAAAGPSLTVDEADLELMPGTRLLKATLTSRIRNSGRDTLGITLPQYAEIQELTLNGQPHVVQVVDGKLQLSLDPGEHSLRLGWQQPGGIQLLFKAPEVNLGTQAVNVRVHVTLPTDRWLLLVGGPRWGPAILFWGYLVFILLASLLLSRLPHSPLREWQWIVLGIGLSQTPSAVLAIIVAWFFAFALLPRWRPKTPFKYNFVQVLLAAGTLVFLVCLVSSVYDGLLSKPDMDVQGAGSTSSHLSWYTDRSSGALPRPWAITTSLWVWRGAMLAWSLWLAASLLGWLRWAFTLFSKDGLWKKTARRLSPPPVAMPTAGATPAYGVAYATGVPGAEWVVTNQAVSESRRPRPPVEEYFPNPIDPTPPAPQSRVTRGPDSNGNPARDVRPTQTQDADKPSSGPGSGSPATPTAPIASDPEKAPPTLPTGSSVAPEVTLEGRAALDEDAPAVTSGPRQRDAGFVPDFVGFAPETPASPEDAAQPVSPIEEPTLPGSGSELGIAPPAVPAGTTSPDATPSEGADAKKEPPSSD